MWEKEFDTSYVGFTKDGAQLLVDNTDIKLVCKIKSFIKTPIFKLCFPLCKSHGGKVLDLLVLHIAGVDYLSAAAYDDLIPSYHVFLEGREIILVEGLKLDNVEAGAYTVNWLALRGLQ
uniref:Uncharacterized protein n=1 Tax=Daucus carota subsp. sativus TaxID=79200 RepID=A0A175YCX6_DAUCS